MNKTLHKRITPLLMMGILSLLGLSGCENWKAVETGMFNGESYELQSMETKGFSTNRIDYALKLGNRKRAVIDALTTDWGPPYADDLYGDATRIYINKNHTPYTNERDDPHLHPSTMLYLSPKRFSREVFDQYVHFLKSEWATIDRQFSRDEYDRFPQIIGLVYGEPNDFARLFRGKKDRKNYFISVEPDGRIRYEEDKQGGGIEYSGLSEKVQMPGKRIFIATGKNAGLTMTELYTYKDTDGKTLSDYFTLQENR